MSQKSEDTDFFSLCTQFSKPFSQIETTILMSLKHYVYLAIKGEN